jgi:hypothetical protein
VATAAEPSVAEAVPEPETSNAEEDDEEEDDQP